MAPSPRRPAAAMPAETVSTSFLLANLHCPTCVSTIKTALQQSAGHHIKWVSPNVVTSVVTVEHAPEASLQQMRHALEESGFEVCGIATSAGDVSGLDLETSETHHIESSKPEMYHRESAFSRWFMPKSSEATEAEKARAHLENCEQCRTAVPSEEDEKRTLQKASLDANLSLPDQVSSQPSSSIPQMGRDSKSFIAIEADEDVQELWRVTLAVGGMTCAACANMITEGLQKNDWVSKVVVNVLANSATVDIKEKDRAESLVEAIEDLGYEATLDTVTDLNQGKPKHKGTDNADMWRATVSIGGMTCASCSNGIAREIKKKDYVNDITVNLLTNSASIDFQGRDNADHLASAIEDLGYDATLDTVTSLSAESSSSPQERTVEILISGLYCPHCPSRILHSLAGFRRPSASSPPSLTHPLLKLTYTPSSPAATACKSSPAPSSPASSASSFILGIVYMSLVPSHNPSKHYLMSPWTSGLSRAQIALFILATPVYFFAADLFHRRAIKEILTLWRRGSKVPVWKRFVKFGSMNTLMSLGTTVAYFSSVGQMIAAGVEKPREVEDANFYFDSVVFSGTVNKDGAVLVRITGVAGTSLLDQIVNVVREGQTKRAPIEQVADLLTSYFVPVVTLIAVLTWILWLALGLGGRIPESYLDVASGGWVAFSLQFAIAVFVVACPCGLALAAPTAIFVGSGLAAKHGILAKGGGEAFEKASRIDCVVFDKTGTLTMGGEPSITDSELYTEDKGDVLAALKTLEENSSHPIAKAIVAFCATHTAHINLTATISNLQEVPGKGMRATYRAPSPNLPSFEIARRINDSPALATADVGIAIGSGADVAISSADFVLVKSDLRSVVDLLDLSGVVFRRIKFNFGWAVVYNCVALPVAAGCFYPIVSAGQHVRLDPVWASLAMALSSISVVLSSLALRVRVRGVGYRERRIE
ncbi:hypothetical protein N0V88_000811 [Collariella sp. IMI 366227]|nr:hypothetical protein N0V88_000811 [Collariella sp. IMI 366227]